MAARSATSGGPSSSMRRATLVRIRVTSARSSLSGTCSTSRAKAVRSGTSSSATHERKADRMTSHATGTREEWLAARRQLLAAEKELTRRSDELARRRQELPWVAVDKEYTFDTDEGRASLADLFGGRSQLLVYHLMFGPDYTAAC